MGPCLSCCVNCATYTHDKYQTWKWDRNTGLEIPDILPITNHHQTKSIHSAVTNKNVDEILRILGEDEGAKIEINNSHETALHLACRLGYVKVVDVLLGGGCVVNVCTELGTPIHCALQAVKSNYLAEAQGAQLVEKLATHGCNIDALARGGRTALFCAAENGNLSCIRSLIKLGAAINVKEDNDFSALYMACIRGDIDSVEVLLNGDGNVDINSPDSAGRSPLLASLITIMNNLRYERLPNDIYNTGELPEENIAKNRHNRIAVIEQLLRAGADPNTVDNIGRTPMTITFTILELEQIRDNVFGACGILAQTENNKLPERKIDDQEPSDRLEEDTRDESVYVILMRLLLLHGCIPPAESNWTKDYSKSPTWLCNLYNQCRGTHGYPPPGSYQVGHPANLQHLCRSYIRFHLARLHSLSDVDNLPLPKKMKDYVAIQYL